MDDILIDRLFVGAGAMKAGTTWLYAALDQHPEIFFTYEKELHYFYATHVRRDVLSETARLENARRKFLAIEPGKSRSRAVRDRLRWVANYLDEPVDDHWYRSLFVLRRNQKWAADFSNLYAHLPIEAWARMLSRTGDLKVLYVMREPLERLWSHVKFHLQHTGQEDALDHWSPTQFEAFLRQPFIWENSEYGQVIRRLRAALPAHALHFAFHEDIHADPRGNLNRIERFLDIPPHTYPEDLLTRPINTTRPRPIPGWFRERVGKDLDRIVNEIRAEGFSPPASWLVPKARIPAEP